MTHREFAQAEHLFKHNESISIGETVWCYGYRYIKIEKDRYENGASTIMLQNGFPVQVYKPGVHKASTRNQFGQKLKA